MKREWQDIKESAEIKKIHKRIYNRNRNRALRHPENERYQYIRASYMYYRGFYKGAFQSGSCPEWYYHEWIAFVDKWLKDRKADDVPNTPNREGENNEGSQSRNQSEQGDVSGVSRPFDGA